MPLAAKLAKVRFQEAPQRSGKTVVIKCKDLDILRLGYGRRELWTTNDGSWKLSVIIIEYLTLSVRCLQILVEVIQVIRNRVFYESSGLVLIN